MDYNEWCWRRIYLPIAYRDSPEKATEWELLELERTKRKLEIQLLGKTQLATTVEGEEQLPWRAEGLTPDERLEELAKVHPECVGLGSRKLGNLIGLSHTTVQRTQWYKERLEARELAKKARKAISRGEYLDQFGN